MSANVYFVKTVNGCKDLSIISLQDEQWRLGFPFFRNKISNLEIEWSKNILHKLELQDNS